MDRDQFFSNLFDDNNPRAGASREQAQRSFEGRIVRRVFSECGVKRVVWGRLVNDCRDQTGEPELTFAWFNSAFPKFPARLLGKRISYCGRRTGADGASAPLYLYQLEFAEIFKPKNNLVLRTLSRALHSAEHDLDVPYVFVFPIVRRMFCAHNLHLSANPTLDVPRIQWIMQAAETGTTMTIEPTASLFAAIGDDWYQSQT